MDYEPPHSIEAEQSVLGSMLLDNNLIERVSFLNESDFYHMEHKKILAAIRKSHREHGRADLMTTTEFYSDHSGAMSYLGDMAKNTPSAANAMAYANTVLDKSIQREVLSAQIDYKESLQDKNTDYLAALEECNDRISAAVSRKSIGEVMSIDELIELSADEMEKSNQNIKTGLSTGIPEVDERLGDMLLAFGEITVLGGLSKNGKTLLANTITARLDLDDDEVGHIFSIEMTSSAMFNAIISAKTGVPANFYRKQAFYAQSYSNQFDTWHGLWGSAAKELRDSRKFKFDGKKEVNADYICSEIRKQAAHAKNNGKTLRYVIIDHLHRMNFNEGGAPMTYAIREAVRKIKNTAADLGVAVLLLAQLNNRAEKDEPNSFHILDSSAVRHEMQAFLGIKMYRQNGETYFGIYADSQRYADQDTKHEPAYMILSRGVLRSLPQGVYFTPNQEDE